MHASIAKGIVNVLAIAAATEITFEEAKPVKALLAASSCSKVEEKKEEASDQKDNFNYDPVNSIRLGSGSYLLLSSVTQRSTLQCPATVAQELRLQPNICQHRVPCWSVDWCITPHIMLYSCT